MWNSSIICQNAKLTGKLFTFSVCLSVCSQHLLQTKKWKSRSLIKLRNIPGMMSRRSPKQILDAKCFNAKVAFQLHAFWFILYKVKQKRTKYVITHKNKNYNVLL